jgi:hypothetical protein
MERSAGELEVLRASPEEHSKVAIEDVLKRLDALALESPNNPQKIYHGAGRKKNRREEIGSHVLT